jgi:hypothetical protein
MPFNPCEVEAIGHTRSVGRKRGQGGYRRGVLAVVGVI